MNTTKLTATERKRRQRRSAHNSHLKKMYGITIQDYDKILASQRGVCAICKGGTTRRHFAVDHNHKNGRVRGLLCARCNMGLAKFMDRTVVVGRAYLYMQRDGSRVDKILGTD